MIAPIPTHLPAARSRLLMQYRHSPNIAALLDALHAPVQEIEDVVVSMYGRLSIPGSQGAQLDGIGRIVGTPRAGWDDAVYRVLLTARCVQLVSRGGLEDIIGVWRLLARTNTIQVLEVYPCQVDLYSDTPIDETLLKFVFSLMRKVPAAGVEIDFPAIIFTAVNDFGFDPDDGRVGGFGDANDPDAGGELTYIQAVGDIDNAYVEAGGDYYITADGHYYIVQD